MSAAITRTATITRRADFLAANRGMRSVTPGFILLVHPNPANGDAMRAGFTVTRKIGNAVVRNRMKRRLRALTRQWLPDHGIAGADHVLIGRASGIERNFAQMGEEFRSALSRIRQGKSAAAPGPRRKPHGNRKA
ncbi:MAG: ribonuclease P protein component [Blastomonas sp.]